MNGLYNIDAVNYALEFQIPELLKSFEFCEFDKDVFCHDTEGMLRSKGFYNFKINASIDSFGYCSIHAEPHDDSIDKMDELARAYEKE